MNANELLKSVHAAVAALDLDAVKIRLMHPHSGEGWNQESADAVEREYRRFLCLNKIYPDQEFSPLADVDVFWHYHILDTRKYAQDCARVFGTLLHHCPSERVDEAKDEQVRLERGERLQVLYEATFGEADPAAQAGKPRATAYCGCASRPPNEKVTALVY